MTKGGGGKRITSFSYLKLSPRCGESSLLSRKVRAGKKRCSHQPACCTCAWELRRVAWGHLISLYSWGSCSSSLAVSHLHWTQCDPCIIKGCSPHTQEQFAMGLEKPAGHLLSVPPLTTRYRHFLLGLWNWSCVWEPSCNVRGSPQQGPGCWQVYTHEIHWVTAEKILNFPVLWLCKFGVSHGQHGNSEVHSLSPHTPPPLTFSCWGSAGEYLCRANRAYGHLPALSDGM